MNVRSMVSVIGWALLVGALGCSAADPEVAPSKAELAAETPPAVDENAMPKAETESAVGPPAVAEDSRPAAVVRDEAVRPAQFEKPATDSELERRTTFYRLDASGPAKIPPVLLSKNHEALCKVKVGDTMPTVELVPVDGGQPVQLADQYGKLATVVVFWKGDRRMARDALTDLGPDVAELFGDEGVAVVGIAVNESAESAKTMLAEAGAEFMNLLDGDGSAFAQLGSEKLPRTYLIDPAGKILWFDIEYSPSTRRELHQALHAVTGAPPESPAAKSQE